MKGRSSNRSPWSMVRKEGFNPDHGAAPHAPHEPIARGALSGGQSRGSLLLRGLRPLGRQQNTLPCHPLLREEGFPPSHSLPRGGSIPQGTQKNCAETTLRSQHNFSGAEGGI